jgi:CspA family cold shock protein
MGINFLCGGSSVLQVGKVKWFDRKKGYGFISTEDAEGDIFVHYSSINGDGFKALTEGDNVQFELTQGPKGLLAQNVLRLN